MGLRNHNLFNPAIYVAAATRIESGKSRYCCNALQELGATHEEEYFFEALWRKQPSKGTPYPDRYFWFSTQEERIEALRKTAQFASVLSSMWLPDRESSAKPLERTQYNEKENPEEDISYQFPFR